jgi:uncharacterized Zn-binding protein involved in type VI secretion
MKRYTITLGAKTTCGGKVISASANGRINGVPIALENDSISCPACLCEGKILCVGPRLPEKWNGKQVALENDLCICRCSPAPRLIANQTLRCQNLESCGGPDETSAQKRPAGAQTVPNAVYAYDLDFLLIDEVTGRPLANCPYVIELANEQHIDGRSDTAGKTAKVSAEFADQAILRVFGREHAPINPHWDR